MTPQSTRTDVREVVHRRRAERLMRSVIADLGLDLSSMAVLTEAASGPFAVTPLLAALAGAEQVFAVARDSRFGSAEGVADYVMDWAGQLGIGQRVRIVTDAPVTVAPNANLVTNLGFVRPIDKALIEALPADAAVALMWEPWEFRPDDVDLEACRVRNVPVLGTWEEHPRLQIFRYLGLLAARLLFEVDVEVFRARVLVVASDPFGRHIEAVLTAMGADVMRVSPLHGGSMTREPVRRFVAGADAVVLAEQRARQVLIGEPDGIPVPWLRESGAPVLHISGALDAEALDAANVQRHPRRGSRPGYMAITTDYLGPRPVIDLHAGGLKVGAALVQGMRSHGSAGQAIAYALKHSPALDFETPAHGQ